MGCIGAHEMTGPNKSRRTVLAFATHAPSSTSSETAYARRTFAALVVKRLAFDCARLAVVNEHGRPAIVTRADPFYDLLSQDHPIVGVYTAGIRIPEIVADLEAAGL